MGILYLRLTKKGRQPRGSAALGYKLVFYQKEEVLLIYFFITNSL